MTDNRADLACGLSIADLDRFERTLRETEEVDLTEAKEGLVDGLLGLTLNHCSGAGPDGAMLYAAKPSAQLVSGFLRPRFNQDGDDETSDIRIATIGMDLQLAAEATGTIELVPELAIYVRVLPSWSEISDPRHDMMPQVQLSRPARQQVDALAQTYVNAALAELEPVVDVDPDERSGDATAAADTARERADVAADEAAGGDADARGTAQAADRAERDAAALAARQVQRRASQQRRQESVSAIRRAAYERAFHELGIQIMTADGSRPVTPGDLEDPETSDAAALDGTAVLDDAVVPPVGPEGGDEEAEDDGPPPATGSLGPLRPEIGRLEDRHASPQPIPQKWRRFALPVAPVLLDIADADARDAATRGFGAVVATAVDAVLIPWLASEEGQREAYRPGEHVLPSHFADEVSWNAYLDLMRVRHPAAIDEIRPQLDGVTLVADIDPDFVDPARVNCRLAIENAASDPPTRRAMSVEHAIFQVALTATMAPGAHRPLRLDRVQPSYRFRDWLDYPAMGLNCGVEPLVLSDGQVNLRTSWAPRYAQPRIDPRDIPGVPTSYAALSNPGTDIAQLLALPDAYDRWIDHQSSLDAGAGLDTELAERERAQHGRDIEAYVRESDYIRAGIMLLIDARTAARALEAGATDPDLAARATPWQAWLHTNRTFAAYGGARYTDWRLFQLAFILAHIPTLASRMPAYADRFDPFRDELSASLLYFPTGGGKSEAFFGLLIFNLFLDRLRGKDRGVTALVRYPLRLLTLQQARRLMRILVCAELVRLDCGIGSWPFEIGFWVGSGNTPNRVAQGFGGVPTVGNGPVDDAALLQPPAGSNAAARRRSYRYREALDSYDKLRSCPACGQPTGMRRYPLQHGRVGIVCFNDATCAWNLANPARPLRVPLPFLLTDDTIYQRAPSVVLGTIDKLALIGQHDRTINALAGMFGAARYRDPQSGHLFMPRSRSQLEDAEHAGWTRLAPAFAQGEPIFLDPFPSLVIQDEGHLLDESLGTFSGLFETIFEQILLRLGATRLSISVAQWTPAGGASMPRLAKVIAATATISDPDRQLRVLYQREPLRFPCPGPSLYESFYSAPREPLRPERIAYRETLAPRGRAEGATPRMRVYVSVMTNGRLHTMTTSAVVSAYHLAFTRIWQALEAGDAHGAVDRLIGALSPNDPLSGLRAAALSALVDQPNVLATLLDLQRISLTYVTNKKGGDQIIETLGAQVERDQRAAGIADQPFVTALISGGVTIAEIQEVMERAEGPGRPGAEFPALGESLRNIVATSAISHGVDVDKFNAMFFAGLPADIAEYIQASSRVGRTHVGFSMLIPTPHSRRDRYVVETHDQFHRFLERMIPPPAVQRWADRAIRRIIPSLLQAYLCGVVEQEAFQAAPDNAKDGAQGFRTASAVKTWADRMSASRTGGGAVGAVADFALDAIGLEGREPGAIGASPYADHYRDFVEHQVSIILELFTHRFDPATLANFWTVKQSETIRKPMTSLRDVDAGGVIQAATRDPWRERRVNLETVRQVMRIIRGQSRAIRSDVDAEPNLIDTEDLR